MANVTNRGSRTNPKWYGKYRDPSAKGGWRQKHTRQLTRAAALRVASEWEARVAQGLPAEPEPSPQEASARELTVLGLLQLYQRENRRRRIHDRAAWQRQTGYYLAGMIAPYPIASRPLDVQRHRDQLLEPRPPRAEGGPPRAGYRPRSVNYLIALLGAAYQWGIDQEVLPPGRNPAHEARCPRLQVPEATRQHYELDELHRLLALPAWAPQVLVALYCALRKGELWALQWDRVHLDGEIPWIDVARAVHRSPQPGGPAEWVLGVPKGGHPRAVPIHPELLPHLREWRSRCPELPEDERPLVLDQVLQVRTRPDLVFPTWNGAVWRIGRAKDMGGLPELLQQAKIADPPADPWHALRHSLATHLTSATGDEHWASLMLGHASSTPRVTRGYVHHGAQPLHLRLLHEALCRLSFEPAAAGVTPITRARGARGERR